jgi:hypothetical protein
MDLDFQASLSAPSTDIRNPNPRRPYKPKDESPTIAIERGKEYLANAAVARMAKKGDQQKNRDSIPLLYNQPINPSVRYETM